MKTLATSLISLLLIGNLSAGNSAGENTRSLKSSLVMPESMKQQASRYPTGQKVSITFVVNEKGDVTEASAKTKDQEAKKDLESQFMKLNFKDLKACVSHTVEINFVMY